MPPITPEQLAEASNRLDKLTQQLEKDVFEDICRRMVKAAKVTDTAEYQLLRLKEMGLTNEFIEKTIADYTKKSEAEIQQLFYEAAQASEDFYAGYYANTGKDFIPLAENEYMQQLITAEINQTHGELVNLTQSMGFAVRQADGTTAFKPVAKTYQSTLDLAQMQVATGVFDYNTAIRNAVISLSSSGLQFVDYASGHRNRADVAARRAILTGLSQMTGQIAKNNAEELETDIVEVTAHAGARPDHAEWQGRRYSLSGKSKEYPSLTAVTGYGTGDGLKGWNCRHDFYPVIPELSPPAYTDEQLANIDPPPIEYNGKMLTYYECTQKQRAMETAMRKTKREVMGAKAVGDDDLFTAKSILLRRQKEEYAKFSDKAGLLTQNERTQVYGFDKSISQKAVWAVKKAQSANGVSSTPAPSGGKAVTVNVPAPASSGKAYTGEKIVKPLDNGGGSGIIISEKQFGKKIGKHAEDYGLDASKEEDRQKMKEIINDIHDNRTEIRTGQFCGQSGDVDFFIKGNDVVICKSNNEFITIMKDGVNNDWVKNARKR
ncbi:MAG: phage minor capsid protein [Oscillospiraceae bacterium]